MRSLKNRSGLVLAAVFAFGLMGLCFGTVRADAPSAHDLADRFAADAERARLQAARRATEHQRRREDVLRRSEEADMLARARSEAAAREADDVRERAEAEARDTFVKRQAAEAAEAARRVAMTRQRQAEAERLSESLRRASDARARRAEQRVPDHPPVAASPSVPLDPPQAYPSPVNPASAVRPSGAPHRYTVLMLMEPGDRGIRRNNKTADPLLCLDHGCYVSNGADLAATLLPRRKAFGIGRTLGDRAGACRDQLGCIFRSIELAALPAHLQPVDMRVVRHDVRETQLVEAQSDCFIGAGRLGCRRPVRGHGYVLWLVPEAMAEVLAPGLLEQALADGLPEAEHAALPASRRY